MRAGTLRHRVALQTSTDSRDAIGGVSEAWATTYTLWAAVEPLRGREYFDAATVQSAVDTRIRIRYHADLDTKMRVLWGTRIYDVYSVIDLWESHKEMHLMCQEIK